jgi:putative ABC transport system permease protein
MFALAIRNFTARKWRSLSTALAVFFGVAMVAGTLMLTASVNAAFDELFTEVNEGIDVTVRPHVEVEGDFGEGAAFVRPLDAAVLGDAQAAEGVESAAGVVGDPTITVVDEAGERIGPGMGPPHIAISEVPEPFSSFEIVDGSAPAGASQAAVDSVTAEREGYEVGDAIRVVGSQGERRYSVSGIGEFGSGAPLGGATLVQFTLEEAQRLTDKVGKFDEIDVEAAAGVTPEELAATLAARLPGSVDVRTGAETVEKDSGDIKDGFGFLSIALLVFAGVSVFVGAFLIFNTFSITVAQRTREFAMLRALGASSRQVLRTVLTEALLVGLLASALGIAGGFGFVVVIRELFSSIGWELPSAGIEVGLDAVLAGLAVGLLTTLVAALSPALRATRVAPLEALVETAGGQTAALRARSRRRSVIAAALIGTALLMLPIGFFVSDEAGTTLSALGLGLVLLFIGLAMVGDRFVPRFASVIGWPIERLRGITGRLARENAQRQPGRTATTAAALMIGVALVVFVGVFASSLRASIVDVLDRQVAGDLLILNSDGFSPVPAQLSDEVAEVDGVGVVSPVASLPARIEPGGREPTVSGIDAATIESVANIEWLEGSSAALETLDTGGAVVDENFAESAGVGIGEDLEITGPSSDTIDVTIEGITTDSRVIVDTVTVGRETLRNELGADSDQAIFLNFEEGADADAVRTAVDAFIAERFPSAEARSQDEFREENEDQINQLVSLIYVLLGLSVLISLFGIVNTLSLTILERTREIGMLRAIGTSRSQVRRMIRYESIVTALLGAIVGVVIGLGLGIGAVLALEEEGLELSIPPTLPVTVLVAAILLGVVAAVSPARRASRIDVIEALQYE